MKNNSKKNHTKEECPLHNLGLGELESTAHSLGFVFPEAMAMDKKMMVGILHDYIEKYYPLSKMMKKSVVNERECPSRSGGFQ